MSQQSQFSVIIPAYNAADTVARSIRSAVQCLASEVIVVDDGSTDATADVAGREPCAVVRQENAGAAGARDTGLRAATSPFVVFLDADDVLAPEGVSESLDLLLKCRTAVAAMGAFRVLNGETDTVVSPWQEGVSFASLLERGYSPGPPAAIVWRRSALVHTAAMSPSPLRPRYAEDYELLLRASQCGQMLTHPKVSCRYEMLGGKSALAPLKSNESAENLRQYYASHAGISIRTRTSAELKAMSLLRRAYSESRYPAKMVALYMLAVIHCPQLFFRLARNKFARWITIGHQS